MVENVDNEGTLLGYYYQDWLWPSGATDSVKSLLLFFDKMAVALPARLRESVIESDPVLALPLQDAGLLVNFDPGTVFDKSESEAVALSLIDAFAEDLVLRPISEKPPWVTRSPEHLGYGSEATELLLRDLRDRGLIQAPHVDGLIRMSAEAKLLVLTVFASHLCTRVGLDGAELSLVTFGREPTSPHPSGQMKAASLSHSRSFLTFNTLWSDLQAVGIDLSRVPLADVLQFRAEHGLQYRAYLRKLRAFTAEVSALKATDTESIIALRREELLDDGADLRRISRSNFGQAASIVVATAASSLWGVTHGDAVAAVLSGLAGALSLPMSVTRATTPFAYLFAIEEQWRARAVSLPRPWSL